MLNSPKLLSTGSTEAVERSDPGEQLQFLAAGTNPLAEVLQRNKLAALPLDQDALLRSFGQSFRPDYRHADLSGADRKASTRVVDPRRQERNSKSMAFEDVDKRPIKTF